MNAVFGTEVHCVAAEPRATFVRVGVTEGKQEVAYAVSVLGRLRGGYRVLQLRSVLGTRIELAYLFVRISFGAVRNRWATPRQQERQFRERSEAYSWYLLMRKRMEGLNAAVGPEDSLPPDVHLFDGFTQTLPRIVFPYSDKMVHLSEEPPPVLTTILTSGKASTPTPLCLGGTWTRTELAGKSGHELQSIGRNHGPHLDEPATPGRSGKWLIDTLVGQDRDPFLRSRALATSPGVKTMLPKGAAAAEKLTTTLPHSNFVWPRLNGSIAVVDCWAIELDDAFAASTDSSTENTDDTVFHPRKVSEFRRAMRSLFGSTADEVPLVFSRETMRNPHAVLVGSRPTLIQILRSRPDVQDALGILELLPDGFHVAITVAGERMGKKQCTLPAEGKCVIYMITTGQQTTAAVESLVTFEENCELGAPIILGPDVRRKLSEQKRIVGVGETSQNAASTSTPASGIPDS